MNELRHLRPLITNGTITAFGQLLDYVSVNQLSKIMDCSDTHIKSVIDNPGKLRFGELIKLSEALGLGYKRVSGLFVD